MFWFGCFVYLKYIERSNPNAKNSENAMQLTEKVIGMVYTEISDTYFVPIVIEIAAVAFSIHLVVRDCSLWLSLWFTVIQNTNSSLVRSQLIRFGWKLWNLPKIKKCECENGWRTTGPTSE